MKRVKKPRTEQQIRDAYLISAFRKIWRWTSSNRRLCLREGRCRECGKGTPELYADHVEPVVDPKTGFVDWNTHYKRLFEGACQPLCKACHAKKTKIENAARRSKTNAEAI